MQVSAAVFKAYDIRGVVPTALNEDFAVALGKAFGTAARAAGETTVAVGRDGRLSGPALSQGLMQGLAAAGIQVIDVGMVTTPMLYYAANTLCRSGIQVTGSHNPKDYNGFKMVLAGRAIYGEDIQNLRRTIEEESWALLGGGGVRAVRVDEDYAARITSDVKLARPLKIVVDSGNGVAGASAPGIFRALGCEVVELFSEVDGNFPNHHPDPSKPENLRDLMAALATSGADLGLAFDGDGDRLGVITRQGNNIYPDRQLMLFAQDVLSRVPGGTILFDVKCTQRLGPAIEAAGGVAEMFKTGHSLIKARMKEVDSPLGGEMSGHIFFKERWFGFDDGTYAGARLLEILSRHPDPSAVLDALPTSFSTPELNVACAEGEPHTLVAELIELAANHPALAAPAKVSTIDGVRVDWPDGFGLIRASNTTPVLVLRFEGHTPEALHRIEATMLALLQQVKPGAQVGAAAH
ncbi:MAG: phosphomannomutase/phosphoglucomutase [Burkholderiales bacterium]|nr:phosphomannomutase/phosphoglucomutase [Burkholderiales bacterium]